MRFALVTDAWHPQVNGVVRSLSTIVKIGRAKNHDVLVIQPQDYPTFPLPSYPEIRLATTPWKMMKPLREFSPDAVHIATEGTLGIFARIWLNHLKIPFTTSYHTRFPEYVQQRLPIPLSWGYRFLKWFHGAAKRVMVPMSLPPIPVRLIACHSSLPDGASPTQTAPWKLLWIVSNACCDVIGLSYGEQPTRIRQPNEVD